MDVKTLYRCLKQNVTASLKSLSSSNKILYPVITTAIICTIYIINSKSLYSFDYVLQTKFHLKECNFKKLNRTATNFE